MPGSGLPLRWCGTRARRSLLVDAAECSQEGTETERNFLFFYFFIFFQASYPPFLNRQGESRLFSRPDKTGFRFGNKGCAIVRIWKCVISSVSYRSVSAALSLLNKVFNSIYSIGEWRDWTQDSCHFGIVSLTPRPRPYPSINSTRAHPLG